MKKWTKALALGLSAAMLMTVAGCGSNNSSKYDLVKDGTLTVGTNAEFPPFESLSNGEVVGVDADMVKAIGEKLGLKVEIQDMAFDSLDSALTSGKIDMIAAGYTIRADRMEKMDFADPYYTAEQTIIVRSDSNYKSKDDLKDKTIGGQTGTTGLIDSALQLTKESNVKGYANGAVAVEDLINGKLDAVIIDNNPAKKGNSELQKAINDALSELKSDGTFDKIISDNIK